MNATLARIRVYPIKSLDGVEVRETRLTERGGLEHDRRFALRDASGGFVNGKRTAALHRVRARFDLDAWTVAVHRTDGPAVEQTFHLDDERSRLGEWLSEATGFAIEIDEDPHGGFPDDTDAAGPTVVAVASLEAVATWLPDLSLESLRRRFRTNLEIAGAPAFWEDGRLGADPERGRTFSIGEVTLRGAKPCARCVVPTRDPDTGEVSKDLAKRFVRERERSLGPGTERERFDHFWRFTLNTLVARDQAGHTLRVGDPVT